MVVLYCRRSSMMGRRRVECWGGALGGVRRVQVCQGGRCPLCIRGPKDLLWLCGSAGITGCRCCCQRWRPVLVCLWLLQLLLLLLATGQRLLLLLVLLRGESGVGRLRIWRLMLRWWRLRRRVGPMRWRGRWWRAIASM